MSYCEQFDKEHGCDPVQVSPMLRIWHDGALMEGDGPSARFVDPPANVHERLALQIRRHTVLLERAAKTFRDAKQSAMAVGSPMLLPQLEALRDADDRIFQELAELRRQLAETPESKRQAAEAAFAKRHLSANAMSNGCVPPLKQEQLLRQLHFVPT